MLFFLQTPLNMSIWSISQAASKDQLHFLIAVIVHQAGASFSNLSNGIERISASCNKLKVTMFLLIVTLVQLNAHECWMPTRHQLEIPLMISIYSIYNGVFWYAEWETDTAIKTAAHNVQITISVDIRNQ